MWHVDWQSAGPAALHGPRPARDGQDAVLRRIGDFGYGAVEPYDVLTDPERLRADLDEAGLAVCSVHARALGEDADALLAARRRSAAAR